MKTEAGVQELAHKLKPLLDEQAVMQTYLQSLLNDSEQLDDSDVILEAPASPPVPLEPEPLEFQILPFLVRETVYAVDLISIGKVALTPSRFHLLPSSPEWCLGVGILNGIRAQIAKPETWLPASRSSAKDVKALNGKSPLFRNSQPQRYVILSQDLMHGLAIDGLGQPLTLKEEEIHCKKNQDSEGWVIGFHARNLWPIIDFEGFIKAIFFK